MPHQKVTPFLWFRDRAEEAARFYVSLFENSRITRVVPGPAGAAMLVEFELGGVGYVAFNGGPQFTLNEAFSLTVDCTTQEEVDFYWEKLCDGGEPVQCGWLKDRYGLWWQIVPSVLAELMTGPDPVKSNRVVDAMMQMVKLDITALQAAYDGR